MKGGGGWYCEGRGRVVLCEGKGREVLCEGRGRESSTAEPC